MTVRSCIRAAQASSLALSSRGHHQAYYKTVQAQGFSEDEDQNHADEQAGLLRIGANACVSNDADSQARCQRAHAHGQTSTQVSVARVCRIVLWVAHLAIDDDSGDEAVDTQDASHDNWDDGAHDHIWTHDAHGGDAHSRLSGSVRGAKIRKKDSRRGVANLLLNLHLKQRRWCVESHFFQLVKTC